MIYKDEILKLIESTQLKIDTEIKVFGQPPTMASSEFLTNKEQGDWAERIVYNAINEFSVDYFAIQYGRSDSIAAGDDGFSVFYKQYQEELNTIGKKPDILIFKITDFPNRYVELTDINQVAKAVAALEIRSSSFLIEKYSSFMNDRQKKAEKKCMFIREIILNDENLSELLKQKKPEIYNFICSATNESFQELDFRCPSWSSTHDLKKLSDLLKELKNNIKILHKRDYLSITPKNEDIALVNRWIQLFNIRHYYLQVFFDKAYVISFKDILKIISDYRNEGHIFSIERDVKNQRKTTIKINVKIGK